MLISVQTMIMHISTSNWSQRICMQTVCRLAVLLNIYEVMDKTCCKPLEKKKK
jgi:hypothetical protein